MTSEEQTKKIDAILIKHLAVDPEKVVPTANLEMDLRTDSLDTVEIAMMLEEEFDIDLPDDELEEVRTVQDVYNIVAKHSA